ncbi:hypothetical protein [Kitasatospora atroaurantiaca]|uniref:SPP1 Gp6-like portal protein n=1 Tax=Kitasatospora atroaurantiaca TaxID=285545 RepID=A0A561EN01_9ACTN|nr:hypothetical protein [Kitasatospora atroaurantiaca]TWE16996.1 hypothetical protein FB465_1993 [Kitasatospora atroaurantiaca]
MGLHSLVIDAWSWLNYKGAMNDPRRPGVGAFPELAAAWLPEDDLRRLAAYKLLAAYDSNQAGQLTAAAGDDSALERRELGDAAKLVDTALGYLLGSEQHIVVPGAEHAEDDQPPQGAAEAAAAQARLRQWAEDELLALRMQQAERTAVLSGDAVYVLAWEPAKGRPTLRSYDPGFYFPQWDDDEDTEFPARVHLAWELPEVPEQGLKARVRRITWEIGPIEAADPGTGGHLVPAAGDMIDQSGRLVRAYLWDQERLSAVTCYLTDAEWNLDDLRRGQSVYNLPRAKARFRTRPDGQVLDRLDLRIDFIPVIHLTNSIPHAGDRWGQSILGKVLQGLDELAATDSDAASASATTGTPIIGLAGAQLPRDRTTGLPVPVEVRAGAVWQLGESGRMDALDTSPQLAELRARSEHLMDRIASSSRLTAAGLGTLDPSNVPSGYTLQLALGPLDSLVASMRLAREHKYKLLLRFVQRLFQAGQAEGWPGGETAVARIAWGPHTPTDRAAVLDEVVKATEAGVLSLETGVRMLMDAGYPIEDAAEEVPRIQARSFDAAARLADATGDNGAVRRYLGMPDAGTEIPMVSGPGRAEP